VSHIKLFKWFIISGGYSKEVTPVPIPNTEVKVFSADGTTWETVWESRTLPEILIKKTLGNHSLITKGFLF
jgi:hypothetical protein